MPDATHVPPRIHCGVDLLCETPALLGEARRVGLVTNDAARLTADVNARSRVALQDVGVPLVRLFGPEHGLTASAADGAAVHDGLDARTGLPVVSLYGARMRPTRESLADLDLMLFDVPDVGARFYTYTWTLYHALAACAESGVPLMVLDRPNPLGGVLSMAEGPLLEPACRSFIGETRVPIRHQLTLGELARLWQREEFPDAQLHVVAAAGWTRAMRWPDTGLPWVPTSPAMPSFESAALYPGTCLFEATTLSVGRGTPWPFSWIGAPWLDTDRLLQRLERDRANMSALAGVELTSQSATPTSASHAGVPCQGVRLTVHDPLRARPVALGVRLLTTIAATHAEQFAWAPYPTAANPSGANHLARLLGRADAASLIASHPDLVDAERSAAWTDVGDWLARVSPILLYD